MKVRRITIVTAFLLLSFLGILFIWQYLVAPYVANRFHSKIDRHFRWLSEDVSACQLEASLLRYCSSDPSLYESEAYRNTYANIYRMYLLERDYRNAYRLCYSFCPDQASVADAIELIYLASKAGDIELCDHAAEVSKHEIVTAFHEFAVAIINGQQETIPKHCLLSLEQSLNSSGLFWIALIEYYIEIDDAHSLERLLQQSEGALNRTASSAATVRPELLHTILMLTEYCLGKKEYDSASGYLAVVTRHLDRFVATKSMEALQSRHDKLKRSIADVGVPANDGQDKKDPNEIKESEE